MAANPLLPNALFGSGLTLPPTTTKTAPASTVPNGTFAGSNLYAVANPSTKRQLLTRAGYSVSKAGPETARLNAAWDNYFHSKGLGAAAWNLTPTQFDPTKGGATTPTNAKTLAKKKGAAAPGVPGQSAADQVPDAPAASIPGSPNFEDLWSKVTDPTNPVGNLNQFAKNYATTQAQTQYNPIIAALNQGIGRQKADTNAAMSGIAGLYKPVQDLAAANIPVADDASQAGIQGVKDIGSQIGQAFGLGPGGGGSADQQGLGSAIGAATVNQTGALEQQGADATAQARAQQQVAQQGQTDTQNSWKNTEQTNINDLKDQLLQAITGRAAAKASGVSAGLQLGQQMQGNYLGQVDQVQTGKEQAALADQAWQKGQIGLQGDAQTVAGQKFDNATKPIVLRDQLLGTAAQRVNTTKQLALQTKTYQLNVGKAQAAAAQKAGGWGVYLNNPKNAQDFASNLRSLLVDSKTGLPITGTTPSSAYNTIAHTMASAGFPANTPQGQQLLVNALQGAGFDLTGYHLGPQGLVLDPKKQPTQLSLAKQKLLKNGFPHSTPITQYPSKVASFVGGLLP